jgi:hypothetical protein
MLAHQENMARGHDGRRARQRDPRPPHRRSSRETSANMALAPAKARTAGLRNIDFRERFPLPHGVVGSGCKSPQACEGAKSCSAGSVWPRQKAKGRPLGRLFA